MRRRIGVATLIGLATVALLAGPAAAGETKFSETCPEVFGQGPVGDLDKHTTPAPESMVTAGQTVDVTLQWPNSVVAGEREHRIMECASTNGQAPWLWADRRLVTGDGTATFSMVVPSGTPAGSKVCGQTILVTKGSFGPVRRWSETTCYRIGAVEEKVMEPLSRRSPAPPDNTTTTDEYDRKRKAEEEKRRKEEERRKKEEEKRKKEEEEKAKREEEEKRKKEEEEKRSTTTTEITVPPTTAASTPPVTVAVPPPTRMPLAAPAAPVPRPPITQPAAQSSRPRPAGGAPGQLARTGTGALGLFVLGGATLVTGRLLRRAFPARRRSAARSHTPASQD